MTLSTDSSTETVVKPKASNFRLQLEDLTFGSIGGMVGKLVEYPFDTIKVRLQTQSAEDPLFKGPMDCLKSTIKEEGMKGLFKGMSSPIIGAMLENAVLFFGYRQIQREIRAYSAPVIETTPNTILEEELPLTLNQLVLAGAVAGSMVSFILTPVELIKCKLQVQTMNKNTSFQGPMDIIKAIFRVQGLRGFYRGFIPTLIRETAGGAFWFGAYEYTCAGLIQNRQQQKSTTILVSKNDLSAPELMLAGAIGGVAYNLSIFPIDAIKSRMQIENNGQRFKTISQITKEIYRGAGIKGFYRGCGMTAAKSAPANAIIFLTYELMTRYFGSSCA